MYDYTLTERGLRMTTFSLVQSLADLRGVSGREHPVADFIAREFGSVLPAKYHRDGVLISYLCGIENPAKPTLLLCAHIDQVGFFVTDITPDGFLRIGNVGGIDRRLLLGQSVKIFGKNEVLDGVISILPPHLLQGEQAVPDIDKLCVDTGFSSADNLRGKVRRGDAVYFDSNCAPLLGTRMTGSALDDRSGAAALILTAQMLRNVAASLPYNVAFAFSTQEERSGHKGAKIASMHVNPQLSIAVDVTFGTADCDHDECFDLDGGPAIGVSSVLDADFSDRLIEIAENAQIPYQIEVMPESTGTDADILAIAPQNGSKAATVSIPLRYMHTPVEVISTQDVENSAALLAAFAKEGGIA